MTLRGPCWPTSAELFPIPAPYEWEPCVMQHQSRRKRMRWRKRRFVELLVNLQIGALNFLHGKQGP